MSGFYRSTSGIDSAAPRACAESRLYLSFFSRTVGDDSSLDSQLVYYDLKGDGGGLFSPLNWLSRLSLGPDEQIFFFFSPDRFFLWTLKVIPSPPLDGAGFSLFLMSCWVIERSSFSSSGKFFLFSLTAFFLRIR